MKLNRSYFYLLLFLLISLSFIHADGGNGFFDTIPAAFEMTTLKWGEVIRVAADRLFWILAAISIVWTGTDLIMKKGDLSDFFGAFLRLIVILGFFYYLITRDGVTDLGILILDSMESLASQASGGDFTSFSPSDILDTMANLYNKITWGWKEFAGALAKFAVFILCYICAIIIVINVILVLITIYITLYAGIILLGFGATNWTRDIAIGYLKQLGNLFIQYFILLLFIVIAQDLSESAINSIEVVDSIFPLLDLFAALLILAFISIRVPPTVGSIVGGAGTGGSSFGIGQALSTLGTSLGASVATAGASIAALGAAAAGLNKLYKEGLGLIQAISEASGTSNKSNNNSQLDGKAIMSGRDGKTSSNSNGQSAFNSSSNIYSEKGGSSAGGSSEGGSSEGGSSEGGSPAGGSSAGGSPAGGSSEGGSSEGGSSETTGKVTSIAEKLFESMKQERLAKREIKKQKGQEKINQTYGGRLAERIRNNREKQKSHD